VVKKDINHAAEKIIVLGNIRAIGADEFWRH
jgi:hypothetical protein